MKRFLSRLVSNLPKRIAAGAIVALALAFPVAVSAAQTVAITGSTGVANVSTGDTSYHSSVNASYNQQIEVEVSYDNTEPAGSGNTAQNLHVKINIPTTPGATQKITTSTSADNSNTVTGSATVNLDRSDAYLEYMPGTAVWKHAVSPNGPETTTQTVSDSVVTSANGLVLENEQPCQAGSITIHATVVVPGVTVTKQSQIAGQSGQWSASNSAQPGADMKYLISYKNSGNTTENNVVISDQLPAGLTLVSGTTVLTNSNHPNGLAITDDDVIKGGEDIGDYLPGGQGYIEFEAKIADASQLTCGENTITNTGYAQPSGMSRYYATSTTMVNNGECSTPSSPTYACTAFHVTVGDNRKVTVDKFTFTASDKSSLDSATLNWGDNSTPLVTNNVKGQTYTYAQDGTYTISLSNFKVDGKSVDVTGNCSQEVTITTPGTPTTPPVTTLPNTGAGDTIGIFIGAIAAGTIAGRMYLSRKLSRR